MKYQELINLSKVILFIIVYARISIANSLVEYSDLELLGASCYPKDTCVRNFRLDFKNRSCECDRACHRFNDCCLDAPKQPKRNVIQNKNLQLDCYELFLAEEEALGIYAVINCPSDYRGSEEIRQYCEGPVNMSNPMESVPVTDTSTNITYKNQFCTQCNNVASENLRSWSVKLECPTENASSSINSDYITNNLVFEPEEDEEEPWGFYHPQDNSNESKQRKFYSCQTPFKIPKSIKSKIRYCRPNIISTCATDWSRSAVRRKCESYTAVVLVNNSFYRNPHCAICNRKDLKNLFCKVPSDTIRPRIKKKSLAFSVLMDIDTSDGNLVNRVKDSRCEENHKFDPFSKSCRSLSCIPGYKPQGEKCVPN